MSRITENNEKENSHFRNFRTQVHTKQDEVKDVSDSASKQRWVAWMEDDIPIAQMLQKERDMSDKVLIKDIWALTKTVDRGDLSQLVQVWGGRRTTELERNETFCNISLIEQAKNSYSHETVLNKVGQIKQIQMPERHKLPSKDIQVEQIQISKRHNTAIGKVSQAMQTQKSKRHETTFIEGSEGMQTQKSERRETVLRKVSQAQQTQKSERHEKTLIEGSQGQRTQKSERCESAFSELKQTEQSRNSERQETTLSNVSQMDQTIISNVSQIDQIQKPTLSINAGEFENIQKFGRHKTTLSKVNELEPIRKSVSNQNNINISNHKQETEHTDENRLEPLDGADNKYLYSIKRFPENVSMVTNNIVSKATPKSNINNSKINMIDSNMHHIDYHDNRAEENHSHWSSDGHVTVYNQSNKKASSRTNRSYKKLKCSGYSSARCQMESRMEDYAKNNGLIVVDVPNDGNCMFASVVDQLHTCGSLEYTASSLRSAVVKHLRENPCQEDGTHMEMFLHYETWEQYLYRMDQDSEWGDHIVLDTIAKILNRCICVVNISLTNQSEAIIQPIKASISQSDLRRTLFLGHFGEEHFVSLRPEDWENTWYHYGDKEKLQTEFEETEIHSTDEEIPNYVKDSASFDKLSNTSLPHFSFLLKYLLKSEYIAVMQSKQQFTTSFTSGETVGKMAGSRADGLNFQLTDKSSKQLSQPQETAAEYEAFCCKCHQNCHKRGGSYALMVHMNSNVEAVYSAQTEISKKYVTPVSEGLYPGYTKLRVLNPDTWNQEDISWSDDSIPYLKHIKVTFDIKCGNCNAEVITERLKKGIQHPTWPNEAAEWINRERPSNWPSPHLVSKIINQGCIVVSRSHPLCGNSDIVWQFLFSSGEQTLIKSLTDEQLRCFSIFKVLFDCHVRNLPGKLSTSLLKHILFYCCEIIPSSHWSENLGGCLLFLFDRLLENLRLHNIPNYFIRENNMICQLPREVIRRLLDKIEAMRKFPILSLIFICERHGLLEDSDIEDVLDDVKNYKFTQNLYQSVTEVFIPLMVDLDQPQLCCHSDDSLIHELQEGFEMVLSAASKCKGIVEPNFQDFVVDIVKPDTDDFDLVLERRFIALCLDLHLQTSIMSNLMPSTDSTALKEIVGEDNKGKYGDLLVPKSKFECVDIIMKFTDILYHFRFYEDAAFYLRYGITRVKEEKRAITDVLVNENDMAVRLLEDNKQAGGLSDTSLTANLVNKSIAQRNNIKRKLCNNNFTILFYQLYSCYMFMNQYVLIQEYVEDFEVVAVETGSVSSLQLLSKIYKYLGNEEKGKEIDQKIISLGGTIPKSKIVTAIVA